MMQQATYVSPVFVLGLLYLAKLYQFIQGIVTVDGQTVYNISIITRQFGAR
jgi:hypothetical protein